MLNHSPVPKLKLLAVFGVAALALAGCGGGDSDEGPDEVTKQFLLAVADQDAETACGYASSAAIEQIEAEGEGTCEEAVLGLTGDVTDEDHQQVEDATYEVSDETEETATVKAVRPDGQEESFDLVKEDGEWKIEG